MTCVHPGGSLRVLDVLIRDCRVRGILCVCRDCSEDVVIDRLGAVRSIRRHGGPRAVPSDIDAAPVQEVAACL